MAKVIHCDCNTIFRAETNDQLVRIVKDHVRLVHPERTDEYTREHVLRLASRLVSPAVQGAP